MKLAVSNIAWPADLDSAAFALLAEQGVSGIEVAPTRVWPEWAGITVHTVREFRHLVESSGLRVSSLQSILFQRPELQLFGSPQALREHLWRCADLAQDLGAGCLVFGAPKNRQRGEVPAENAFEMAAEFFSSVSEYYAKLGLCIGLEPNPREYGCDFVTETGTAARLVRRVNSPGFRLHLDSACLYLAGESPRSAVEADADILAHFHASEPYLGAFAQPVVPHSLAADSLRRVGYTGWVALEMRSAEPVLPSLRQAIGYLKGTYA